PTSTAVASGTARSASSARRVLRAWSTTSWPWATSSRANSCPRPSAEPVIRTRVTTGASHQDVAAVDEDDRAGGVRLVHQVDVGRRNVLRLADPPDREVLRGLVVVDAAAPHRRPDD